MRRRVSTLVLLALIRAGPAFACSCIPPGSPSDETARATAVFLGEVTAAGEQVFRPLIACTAGSDEAGDGALFRGGNTFVFDIEALRDAPNAAPVVSGRVTRRSDMIWALLQRYRYGRRLVRTQVAVVHDRTAEPVPGELDAVTVADDIRGYAVFNALRDHWAKADSFEGRFAHYRQTRLNALDASFHRILGLTSELRHFIAEHRSSFEGSGLKRLARFAERLEQMFSRESADEVRRLVGQFTAECAHAFHADLDDAIVRYKATVDTAADVRAKLDEQRIDNALAALRGLGSENTLRVLGVGSEAVVVTDGSTVFRAFDYWKPKSSALAKHRVASMVGAWAEGRGLYRLDRWVGLRTHDVLAYRYEETVPYGGGHGPALVDLLVECYRVGLVCRNVHPKNLRVAGDRVRLVDYGADLQLHGPGPAFEEEFVRMCRRAYLSWRWTYRNDLAQLLSASTHEPTLPELEGFGYFLQAVRESAGTSTQVDPVFARACELGGERILDYGCGKGETSLALAEAGHRVVAYDPDPNLRARLWGLREKGIIPVCEREALPSHGAYDLIICRRVACLVSDATLDEIVSDIRRLLAAGGRVLFAVCHPVYSPICTTWESTPVNAPASAPFPSPAWTKALRATGHHLQEVCRTERRLRRTLGRAGLRVVGRMERSAIDQDRFEPAADLLVFELEPASRPPVTLMIKCCAMDADVLGGQVRHLVRQLEHRHPAHEVLLAVDSKQSDFLRPHTEPSSVLLMDAATRLQAEGWIDRIVRGPVPGPESRRLNRDWLGLDGETSHADNGAQLASVLAGFSACQTRYLLHADVDVMVGTLDEEHDAMGEMLEALAGDDLAATVAFNIAREDDRPYTPTGPSGPWRVESRLGLVDLERLRTRGLLRQHPGAEGNPPWHRRLDAAVKRGDCRSLRGGSRRSFFIHPQNGRKSDHPLWERVRGHIEAGRVSPAQHGYVDWVGTLGDWHLPARSEPFVFVVCGRNVPPARARRCLDSIFAQRNTQWGAIVVDDDSRSDWADELAALIAPHRHRITLVRRDRRHGLLANTVEAIRHLCADSGSVIVTLDLDDALIGPNVLDEVRRHYADGADVTVGSMLRTDKPCDYPVQFSSPRLHRGGNVWQHLRTFRKYLFDAIPDEALRSDGDYFELANDWAFMLPIIEMSRSPRYIQSPLYLHEPSGPRNDAVRREREQAIARLMARSALRVSEGTGV